MIYLCNFYSNYCSKLNTQNISSNSSNWMILLTAVLAIATIVLAIFTALLWCSTRQYTKETKIANEISKESNRVAEQTNLINLMTNLLTLKVDIESIFVKQVRASYMDSFEKVLLQLKSKTTEEEKKGIIDASKMLTFIDPLIDRLEPAYDNIENSFKNCIDKINKIGLDQINLKESFEYIFSESLLVKGELSSRLGDLAGNYASKKIFLLNYLEKYEDLRDKALATITSDSGLEIKKIVIDLMKEIDRLTIEEVTLKADGIKEINSFLIS